MGRLERHRNLFLLGGGGGRTSGGATALQMTQSRRLGVVARAAPPAPTLAAGRPRPLSGRFLTSPCFPKRFRVQTPL